jgi:hypothetical protein
MCQARTESKKLENRVFLYSLPNCRMMVARSK